MQPAYFCVGEEDEEEASKFLVQIKMLSLITSFCSRILLANQLRFLRVHHITDFHQRNDYREFVTFIQKLYLRKSTSRNNFHSCMEEMS